MKIQCATCGAEQQVVNPAAISVQCPYCDSIIDACGQRLEANR